MLYSNWAWDPGLSDAGWRRWNLGTDKNPAFNVSLGADSMVHVFITPEANVGYDPASLLTWSLGYNFDKDPSKEVLSAALHDAVSTNSMNLRAIMVSLFFIMEWQIQYFLHTILSIITIKL